MSFSLSFPRSSTPLTGGLFRAAALAACVALAAPAADAAPPTTAPRYTWVDRGTLGGPTSTPTDIDERRRVVGSATRNDRPECLGIEQPQPCVYAFLWAHGHMTDLGHASPEGLRTFPTRINSQGLVVGYEEVPATGDGAHLPIVTRPFAFQRGTFRTLPLLAADPDKSGLAYGLNDLGVATGFSEEAGTAQTLVTWTAEGVARGVVDRGIDRRGLGINASGTIAGWQYRPRTFTPTNGFVQEPQGRVVNLSAADVNLWSEALDINDDGVVVGDMAERAFEAGQATAWRRVDGHWVARRFGALPGHNHSVLSRVNGRGDAVGFSEDPSQFGRSTAIAVLDGQLVDLNTLVSLPRVRLVTATAINDRGDIVGEAVVDGGALRGYLLLRQP